MALDLRFDGDPVLRAMAVPVTVFDSGLAGLVKDMFAVMYAAPGRGLAAPQVGVSQRVFVIDTTWKEAAPTPQAFINPQIVAQSGDHVAGTEACLSIPCRAFSVVRPTWIDLEWQDLDGMAHQGRFDGIEAICICHEFDHLNGVLITDIETEQ